jgi:hypothetical protein
MIIAIERQSQQRPPSSACAVCEVSMEGRNSLSYSCIIRIFIRAQHAISLAVVLADEGDYVITVISRRLQSCNQAFMLRRFSEFWRLRRPSITCEAFQCRCDANTGIKDVRVLAAGHFHPESPPSQPVLEGRTMFAPTELCSLGALGGKPVGTGRCTIAMEERDIVCVSIGCRIVA